MVNQRFQARIAADNLGRSPPNGDAWRTPARLASSHDPDSRCQTATLRPSRRPLDRVDERPLQAGLCVHSPCDGSSDRLRNRKTYRHVVDGFRDALNPSVLPRRRGNGAPRGRWCGSPHPWCSPVSAPADFVGKCEGEAREHRNTLRGAPRASDVGARALAALHRRRLSAGNKPAGAAPRSAFDAFRKTPSVEPGWLKLIHRHANKSRTKVSKNEKIDRRPGFGSTRPFPRQ
jgi:hypothetical protein